VTFWNYTAPSIELLLRWIKALSENPGAVDDQVLDAVFNCHQIPMHRGHLRKRMNWMTGLYGAPGPEVIIRHDYQPTKDRPSQKDEALEVAEVQAA